jgi:hypothetical protein
MPENDDELIRPLHVGLLRGPHYLHHVPGDPMPDPFLQQQLAAHYRSENVQLKEENAALLQSLTPQVEEPPTGEIERPNRDS